MQLLRLHHPSGSFGTRAGEEVQWSSGGLHHSPPHPPQAQEEPANEAEATETTQVDVALGGCMFVERVWLLKGVFLCIVYEGLCLLNTVFCFCVC